MRRFTSRAGLGAVVVLLLAVFAGCGEDVELARAEAELAAGKTATLCDATIQPGSGALTIERRWNRDAVALAGLVAVWIPVILGWLLLGKARRGAALVTLLVLVLAAAGLSAFVGTERFAFDQGQRRVQMTEGWFFDLYTTRRSVAYGPGVRLAFAEEDEGDDSGDRHWMRLWLRTSGASWRVLACRAVSSNEEALRQGLPRLARTLEGMAGLRGD